MLMNKELAARAESILALRQRLRAGDPSVGTWCQINSPTVASILAADGFEWVCLDLEHGEIALPDLVPLTSAIHAQSKLAFARLASIEPSSISRALDYGCDGLILPKVETLEDCRSITRSSYYPPQGERGVAFMHANSYGRYFDEYFQSHSSPFLVAMIETATGVDSVEDILRSDTIDALLIGPYDLSASLGVIGQLDHPLMDDAIKHILHACRLKSIPCGVHIVSPDQAQLSSKISAGFTFIPYGLDTIFLQNRRDS